jgi:hypothetical protein
MTSPTLTLYIQHIAAPSVDFLRTSVNDQDLNVSLIMDNHSVHNGQEILSLYNQYGVVPISFPPHSPHRFQPLAVQVFNSFKSQYAKVGTRPRKPQLEGMLLRNLHAWYMQAGQASYTVPGDSV